MTPRRLLLVDGTQLFYRSFFAIKGLSTHDGKPSNAVFGFVRGIHQLIEGWKPSHLAVAWDSGPPAARLAILPEYKAQRPPMPDALRQQYDPVSEFLSLAGITLVRREREEADDLLASLDRWGEPDADEILVATSDKDLFQLVSSKTSMVSWGKDDRKVGRNEVFEKTGVYPGQIVEWLALTGDTVDNIPGVGGMGPKTAAKLLEQFGSLPAMWQKLDEVKSPRVREHLVAGRGRVERNLALVKLVDTLDCSPGWEAMSLKLENPATMRPFYTRMEFHSLIKGCDQGELF